MALFAKVGKSRRFIRSPAGGAAVELAVVFPVLVLLLIGVADYGRVFFTSIAVANAARAGAEWGANSPGNAFGPATNIENFAKQDGIEAGAITVAAATTCRCGPNVVPCSTTPTCAGYGVPRAFVEVTASKTVSLILPYPGVPNNLQIVRKATFRSQ